MGHKQTIWYTVTSPTGAWIKTWSGHTSHDTYVGSAQYALDEAREQCRGRNQYNPGHRIEVREYHPELSVQPPWSGELA